MADDGLREIQLGGKHLISLFMTAAVVLVVTFLCGVLVGRGVRAQKEPVAAASALPPGAAGAADPTAPVTALQPLTKTTPQAQQAPPTAPPPPEEDLSYYSRLEGKSAPPESAKASSGAARAAVTPKPVGTAKRVEPPSKPAAAPKAAAPTASAEPAGSGYVVKIVAYRDKAQAEALASRLSGKGYAAFVVAVSGKGAPLYSVRVGKFKARADADAVRRRLEKEEQFKPLVTR
jgi:cell division septation protein DedD